MTLRELIDSGNTVIENCTICDEDGYRFCSGKEYQNWLSLSMRFVEQTYPNDADTKRFTQLARNANGRLRSNAEELISILEAFDAVSQKSMGTPIEEIIMSVCQNFDRFDRSMQHRHDERPKFEIKDEYDVQDALCSILRLFVNDVRTEDYVPENAGAGSRVDFNLPDYGIIIETKMASPKLKDNSIGEQLTIDFFRYKALPESKHLICFVYDKNRNLSNPQGLKSDLEKLSDNQLKMTVIVSP